MAGRRLLYDDGVLQRVRLLHVFWVVRVDECTKQSRCVPGANLVEVQSDLTRAVHKNWVIVVLADDQ